MARRGGDKIHNKTKELNKKAFERQTKNKLKVPDVIIACEDSVSSPTYFKMIVKNLIDEKLITQDSFVIAENKHSNPMGVLEDLKNHKSNNGKVYKDFKHKWIVIDRDIERVNGGGHNKEDFNNAIQEAKKLKVKVAYANDSFELWYLLHFDYRTTAILRDEILEKVIEKLKTRNSYKFAKLNKDNIKQENYTKLVFDELSELQEIGIKNGEKLLTSYGMNHNPESDNPSTTVHLLVELLKRLNERENV